MRLLWVAQAIAAWNAARRYARGADGGIRVPQPIIVVATVRELGSRNRQENSHALLTWPRPYYCGLVASAARCPATAISVFVLFRTPGVNTGSVRTGDAVSRSFVAVLSSPVRPPPGYCPGGRRNSATGNSRAGFGLKAAVGCSVGSVRNSREAHPNRP